MRLIDADAMAHDLEHDVELCARALDDMNMVGKEREDMQWQKDCKQNCMWYLSEQPTAEAIPFKWTPFKKQKPPKTDDYLITYPLGVGRARYVTVATWHSVLEIWEGFRTEAVIAWAEIPKPYGDEL